MTTNREQKHVKMNLCIDKPFFDLLQEKADQDYMRVSTWTKWFLKKTLLDQHKKANTAPESENII